MIKINESKSYEISSDEWLSASDLKDMKVGTRVQVKNSRKEATKVGPDSWNLYDGIDTIKGLSSRSISNAFEDYDLIIYGR